MRHHWALLVVVTAAVAVAAAGCGSGEALSSAAGVSRAGPAPKRAITTLPRAERVIKAWAAALERGDVNGAAAYFAVPSLFADGVDPNGQEQVVRLTSVAETREANEALDCGARFVSASRAGRFIEALFVLTGRPGPGGTDCGSGAGETARTDFVIANGKIEAWIRAPDQAAATPSPNPTPTPTPTPSAPPATGAPGPVV